MALFTQKERIEKMRTFSEPDSAVEVSSPSLWLAVVAGVLLVAALLVWMTAGRIPRTLVVEGVYMGDGRCVCFADLGSGKVIEKGMEVKVCPETVSAEEYGNILAGVTLVDSFDTDYEEAEQILGSASLAEYFLREPAYYFVCELEGDPATASGFRWSSGKGSGVVLKEGTLVTARVSLGSVRPFSLVFPAPAGAAD